MLLVVLAGSSGLNVEWRSPAFQAFLEACSAVLAALISYWLYEETRMSFHPGVLTLSIGFAFLSLTFGAEAWLRQPANLDWWGSFTGAWAVVFSLASVVLIAWRGLRRALREVLQRRPGTFWAGGLLAFGAVLALTWIYGRPTPDDPVGLSPILGRLYLGGVAVALAFSFRLYLKRRTSVVLSFTVALYVFGLGIASRISGTPWHTLWWYGQIMNFNSLFLVAYGILEGKRARERESLITQLEELTGRLEELSVLDPLTSCFNRRYAMEVLESECRKSSRTRLPLTLLTADVDNFKPINDTYGHPCGDSVLRELCDRMRAVLRTSDVLARAGGEEFWIILPQTNRVGGQEVAAKLLGAVRSRPFEASPLSLRVTMSVGIADNLTPGVKDVPSLVAEADRALYAAKRAGKDRAVIRDPFSFEVPQKS